MQMLSLSAMASCTIRVRGSCCVSRPLLQLLADSMNNSTFLDAGSKLYILNATLKCSKDAGCSAAQRIVVLKRAADSFDVGTK